MFRRACRTSASPIALLAVAVVSVVTLQLSLHRPDLPPEAALRLRPLAGNVVLVLGYLSLWLLIVRRTAIALAIGAFSVGVLGLANSLKVRELGEPITLFDVFLVRNAPILLDYVPSRSWVLLAAAALGLAILLSRAGAWRARRASVALPLACVAAAGLLGRSLSSDGETWGKRVFATYDVFWDPLARYHANGFFVASLLDVPQLSVAVPERYDQGLDGTFLEPFLACDRDERLDSGRKHVVVVMLESFWDPTEDGLAFDQDPLPLFRGLRERGAVQRFISPVFGSRTANAEFEVLTGLSTLFSPIGSIPYQQYVKRPIASVASVFREAGYATVAVHNFRRRFWNRDAVYPRLGFDEYVALEDLGEVPWELGWPSDAVLFDRVERILAEAERPTFVFAVTVATHGPYSGHGLEPTVQMVDGARPELVAPMSIYASKLALLDQHFGSFVARLDETADPPIVVAFADHLPSIAARALSRVEETPVPRSHVVEALILGAPTTIAEAGPRSLSCLGPEILRLANVSAPPFFRFVEELCTRIPIVTAPPADDSEELLRKYHWLTYDRLFGKGYSIASCDVT